MHVGRHACETSRYHQTACTCSDMCGVCVPLQGGVGAVVWFPVIVKNVSEDELFGMTRGPTHCPHPSGCYW